MSLNNGITLDIFSQYSNFSFDAFSSEELANLYIDISKPTFSWLFGKYSSCLRLGGSRILKFCHLVHIDSDFTPSVPKQIIDEYFSSDPKKLIDSLQLYADARMTSYTLLKNYLGDFLPRFFGMDIKLIPYRYIVEHKLILSGANLSEFNLAQLPIKETNIVELWESYPLLNTLYSFRYSRLKDLYYDATYKNSIRSFARSLESLLSSENVLADILHKDGLLLRSPQEEVVSKDVAFIEQALNSGVYLPVLRNTSIYGDSIKYFDTFPLIRKKRGKSEIYKVLINFLLSV